MSFKYASEFEFMLLLYLDDNVDDSLIIDVVIVFLLLKLFLVFLLLTLKK